MPSAFRPTDVSNALAQANTVLGAGKIEDRHRLYLVLVQNRLATPQDIAAIPVKADATGAGVVTLGSIARVRPSAAPSYTLVNSNGQSAVLVNVRQALDGNTVQVVKDAGARLDALALPPSVKVTPFYDQSELVKGAANAVRDAILIGALLAGLVLFLFLRSAATDGNHGRHAPGGSRGNLPDPVRAWNAFRHDDAGRHGRCSRSDRR